MRVAFNNFPDSLAGQLNNLSAKQLRLQNQAATGRRISQLSDDPAAMRRVLDLQTQDSEVAQYRQNIASLQQRATSSYTAISKLHDFAARAGDIATLANGARSTDSLATYAAEVDQMIQDGVQLMNSQNQGDYLFGGTKTDQPPFVVTKDAAGIVTGVSYQGNGTVPSVEVARGATVSVQVPGANTTGSGPTGLITDSRNGADFFNHLIALSNHLKAGDTAAIASTDQAALAKDEDNITLQMGTNGVVQSQLNTADSLAATQASALRQAISQNADVDLATTLTQLSTAQTAYQAALQSGAALLNSGQSLLDYLH